MTRFFYNAFIFLYPRLLKAAAVFNPKAGKWVTGREEQSFQASPFEKNDRVVWIHAASVGEFEQGLPVIKAIKEKFPSHKILLTFFSPSGFEAKKNTTDADLVLYLPMDSTKNAEAFIHKFNPVLAIFIKYEFWYYYLQALKNKNTPALLVSAVFRKDQPFFKWYGDFFRSMLSNYDHIFVQDDHSSELLKKSGISNFSKSGDTRFDRVAQILQLFKPIHSFEKFASQKTLVAGSTWSDDDKLLSVFAQSSPHINFIIAPHDINDNRLKECLDLYPTAILFSQMNDESNFQTLIIDNVGMLSRLYHYATVTYIGGGFTRDGIHNSLEAAAHSKPVVFGPEYSKYNEAKGLINTGGAFSFSDQQQLNAILNKFFAEDSYAEEVGRKAGEFVKKNTGATEKVIQYIQEKRLLTN